MLNLSCAIWGGDLSRITTERENNYLYTIIPDTVSNCWIGLNDRDVEGNYTWIDGTEFTHSNFTNASSNDEANDCVRIINTGNAVCGTSVSCDITLSAFLCKRNSSSVPPGLLIIVFTYYASV